MPCVSIPSSGGDVLRHGQQQQLWQAIGQTGMVKNKWWVQPAESACTPLLPFPRTYFASPSLAQHAFASRHATHHFCCHLTVPYPGKHLLLPSLLPNFYTHATNPACRLQLHPTSQNFHCLSLPSLPCRAFPSHGQWDRKDSNGTNQWRVCSFLSGESD